MEIDDSELVEDSEPGIDGVAFSGDDKLSKLSDFEEGSDDRDNEYINRAPGVENFCYGEEMSLQFEFHGDHPEQAENSQKKQWEDESKQEVSYLNEKCSDAMWVSGIFWDFLSQIEQKKMIR